MTKKEHTDKHIKLHQKLDELIADYISCTNKTLSESSIMDLIQWSYEQTRNPQSIS